MWDYQELYNDEVANDKTVGGQRCFANFVFGQCFSGGFVDGLTKIGCVLRLRCNMMSTSYALSSFTMTNSCITGHVRLMVLRHSVQKTSADYDGNGHVSMEEAFKYAKAHDSLLGSMEHPQYVSTPIYLGKDLAFDYLPVSGLTCSYAIMTRISV